MSSMALANIQYFPRFPVLQIIVESVPVSRLTPVMAVIEAAEHIVLTRWAWLMCEVSTVVQPCGGTHNVGFDGRDRQGRGTPCRGQSALGGTV